ncbi:MAG: acetylglucosamine transferase [Comamonadaceae bacterium CG12_big_fil_rev_8_21_14_0_65_59_15]|nr:MAG: acetylglucosamine transferase [Comamonadaceae bacterium CG12_big_fil_rev_8_21_14_0_65_59_15]
MTNRAQRRASAKKTKSGTGKHGQLPLLAGPSAQDIEQVMTLFNGGHYAALEQLARQIVAQFPQHGLGWKVLGTALKLLGRTQESLEPMKMAATLLPDDAEAQNNYGVTLKNLGQFEQAQACYRRALAIKPDYAWAHTNLGNALKEQGRFMEAEASYHRALVIEPNFAEAYLNLGITLYEQGRLADAETSYRRALAIQPDMLDAHNKLGVVLKNLGRLTEAEALYRRALEIKPDFVDALTNLGVVLKDLGRLDESVAFFRRALEIKPNDQDARSNLLFTINYAAALAPASLLAQARDWEAACIPQAVRSAARARHFNRQPRTSRRLRVGYISTDFRQHAVSYFVEQLFARHDAGRVEVFAYSLCPNPDAVTARLAGLVQHWVPVAGLSDQSLFERIDADQLDVLIDLNGHTANNRLGVLARRAAPVQAHWLGYFATTGLTEVDYWIGDPILTPPETDPQFSEKVWRLPRTWVSYEGKAEAPASHWQPDPGGAIWLGSFNNLVKLTPATIALWARVLNQLPKAKLLLKTHGLAEQRNRERIAAAFMQHGIDPLRVELLDASITKDWRSHMACYDRVDIALDPVGGLGGGTTSCDALWMGVPVVTLMGDRMASRMTASMLCALGMADWVSNSEDDYVNKVVVLADDIKSRQAMRPNQRARMARSPLCDAAGLARALEDAYEAMFDHLQQKNSPIGTPATLVAP